MNGKPWTPSDVKFLRAEYFNYSRRGALAELAALMGRGVTTVVGRASLLHIWGSRVYLPIEALFLKRVPERPEDSCWEWAGQINDKGYGIFAVKLADGSRTGPYAHRVSWELSCGSIPPGLFVCHHCDNPPCVNPSHLFLGTPADNARDCQLKGRHARSAARGEKHPSAKLTRAQAVEIFRRAKNGERQRSLGDEFGINRQTVSKIAARQRWREATESL